MHIAYCYAAVECDVSRYGVHVGAVREPPLPLLAEPPRHTLKREQRTQYHATDWVSYLILVPKTIHIPYFLPISPPTSYQF